MVGEWRLITFIVRVVRTGDVRVFMYDYRRWLVICFLFIIRFVRLVSQIERTPNRCRGRFGSRNGKVWLRWQGRLGRAMEDPEELGFSHVLFAREFGLVM